MFNIDLPRYLYKFRNFDSIRHLNILLLNEIYFASSKDFNDPFDCKIPVHYHLGSEDEMAQYWRKVLIDNVPNKDDKFYDEEIKKIINSGTLIEPKAIEHRRQLVQESIAKAFGIFSTSATISDILLWSHYSLAHTGFAVGFDTKALSIFCKKYMMLNNKLIYPLKVEYSKSYPNVNAYSHSNRERFHFQVLTKALDWRYEQEYRIVLQNSPNSSVILPEGIIKRIVLGSQVSIENRTTVIEILKQKNENITLFQSKCSRNDFRLQFEKIFY